MNIFILSEDPVKAAQMQCDKHVVKMVLESAQLLCSIYDNAPYKITHYNHPCSQWARRSIANYEWLLDHAKALAEEYTLRYGKTHKSEKIIDWCSIQDYQWILPDLGLTPFELCMPAEYKKQCPVESYREFYTHTKSRFAKWNKARTVPDWWNIKTK